MDACAEAPTELLDHQEVVSMKVRGDKDVDAEMDTRMDRIRNEVFRERLRVACITEKIRDGG